MKDNYTSEGSLFRAASAAAAVDIYFFIVRTFHSLTRASS